MGSGSTETLKWSECLNSLDGDTKKERNKEGDEVAIMGGIEGADRRGLGPLVEGGCVTALWEWWLKVRTDRRQTIRMGYEVPR